MEGIEREDDGREDMRMDDVDMVGEYDERVDESEQRRCTDGTTEEEDYQYYRPWYGFLVSDSSGRGSTSPSSTSSNDSVQEDCREQELHSSSNRDYDSSGRIHVPLKRYQDEINSPGGRSIKRRRTTATTDSARMAFFGAIPALTEQQQSIVEYSAPAVFTPLFKVLGYTPFAVTWVITMYLLHFLQTMLSTFGKNADHLHMKPWIPPLVHYLMDTYLWNHSMITYMLLAPEVFGDTAYWLAVFFTMGQQQAYLAMSLKTHYTRHKDNIKDMHLQHYLELRLGDTFIAYAIAAILFTVSKLFQQKYLLYIGLLQFNFAPIYLVASHKQRIETALQISATEGGATKKEQ